MTPYLIILGAFLLSALCGFIILPIVMNYCKDKGLYDVPNSRKVHKNAIPRLGGVSFLPSMAVAVIITFIVNPQYFESQQVSISLWSVCFFLSLTIIYGIGIIDDLIGLGAIVKFFAQIVAASIMPVSGLYINNLYGFCGINEIPFMAGAVLTVFVIVLISNAINLIDGIDGLSACLSFIALAGFLAGFAGQRILSYGILIAGLMGVLVSFLYFNFFGKVEKNRKIFMGDSGSLTLGFILGFLFVKYIMKRDLPGLPGDVNYTEKEFILAYSLLIVPVYDVIRVSLVRLYHRNPIFQADKNHIHHKLMRVGLAQHQALACILGLAILFIIVNMTFWDILGVTSVIALDILLWLAFHFVLNCALRRKGCPVFQKNIV